MGRLRLFLSIVGWISAAAWPAAALGQQRTDSGALTLQATVSGYVDVASGGQATLTGNSSGQITGNTNRGDRLTGMSISFGDVSPASTSNFVRATVPLRLRSNIPYVLSMSATTIATADPLAVQLSDIGFGIDAVRRSDPGVFAGNDSPFAAAFGDPSLTPVDQNTSTARWDYKPEQSLAYYSTPRAILSGERVMSVAPGTSPAGLTLNTFFVIKPQFFSPGAFSTTVTFTVSTP